MKTYFLFYTHGYFKNIGGNEKCGSAAIFGLNGRTNQIANEHCKALHLVKQEREKIAQLEVSS
jgi:hypothetical protein